MTWMILDVSYTSKPFVTHPKPFQWLWNYSSEQRSLRHLSNRNFRCWLRFGFSTKKNIFFYFIILIGCKIVYFSKRKIVIESTDNTFSHLSFIPSEKKPKSSISSTKVQQKWAEHTRMFRLANNSRFYQKRDDSGTHDLELVLTIMYTRSALLFLA